MPIVELSNTPSDSQRPPRPTALQLVSAAARGSCQLHPTTSYHPERHTPPSCSRVHPHSLPSLPSHRFVSVPTFRTPEVTLRSACPHSGRSSTAACRSSLKHDCPDFIQSTQQITRRGYTRASLRVQVPVCADTRVSLLLALTRGDRLTRGRTPVVAGAAARMVPSAPSAA